MLCWLAIDVSASVLFVIVGLVVDVSDVVACSNKFFDELMKVDVVGLELITLVVTLFAVTLFAVTLFAVTFFIIAGFPVFVDFAFIQ